MRMTHTTTSTVWEPGNMTRYEVLVTHISDGLAVVTLVNFGKAAVLPTGEELHPDYVASKLSVSIGDATALLPLLAEELA